jgi:hypothetical protein
MKHSVVDDASRPARHKLAHGYLPENDRFALGGAAPRHAAHGGGCVAYFNYIIRLLDTRRTIILLTNHLGVPGPRIRAHQVAEILFSD